MGTASPLETERLSLRPMVAADLDDLLGIFGDPQKVGLTNTGRIQRDGRAYLRYEIRRPA